MRNILMLALANLRKNKGQAVSVLVLMLFATTLLSVGLIVLTDISSFVDERIEYLYIPHFVTAEEINASNNDRLEFIEQFPGVTTTETQDLIAGLGGFQLGDIFSAGPILIVDGSVDNEMSPLSLIGDYLPLEKDAIYIPHFAFMSGYELGDTFSLELLGIDLDFTVAGSTEEILFGNAINWRFYVSAERFLEIVEQFPNNHYRLLMARLEDVDDAAFLLADYNYLFFGAEYATLTFGSMPLPLLLNIFRDSLISFPSVIAVLLTAFSLILLIVGIIVIRFRIVSSIEEGMTNIGALKAVGYRNHQIIASIVLQFGMLAFVGSLLGILVSYLLIPLFAVIFEPLLGLVWDSAISVLVPLIVVVFLVLLIVLFSFLSARRIGKLHPLVALRGGLGTHNFKKNSAALDLARSPLVVILALKQLLQNKKQAFAISLIIAGLMVAAVMGLGIHYNMNVNTDAFINLLAGDLPDVVIMVDDEAGGQEAIRNISARSDVEVTYGAEFVMMFVDEVVITKTVIEDFSYIGENSLIDGRFPRHDNEIVLGQMALIVMDKEIGDWVVVRSGNVEREYLVTGVLEIVQHGGFVGMMGVNGKMELQPDFVFTQFNLDLVDDVDANAFIDMIREAEGDALNNVVSMYDETVVAMDGIGGVFALITVIIFIVSIVVIILVLYLIIKTAIRRRRREFGIQKALGFTTYQLMNQISLSLMPTILLGAIIGAIVGYFGFNPLFITLTRGMGVVQADMPMSPLSWTVLVSIALVLLAYTVSMLIAWRIRKISAYALVVE